jgi:DNA (cytosine-5)-methyltransferase 1
MSQNTGKQPRVLDLYCGAGGASRGYAQAGYAPTGIDNNPAVLRNYPYPSIRADALAVLNEPGLLTGIDLIHASPPCQTYSITRHTHATTGPDLLARTIEALDKTGKPWVVENVVGAPLDPALTLCGTMFGLTAADPATGRLLTLRRHRLFASPLPLIAPAACTCRHTQALDKANLRPTRQPDRIGGVYGGGSNDNRARKVRRGGYTPLKGVWEDLMGINWMTRDQLAQAIPPAYTRWIGTLIAGQVAA